MCVLERWNYRLWLRWKTLECKLFSHVFPKDPRLQCQSGSLWRKKYFFFDCAGDEWKGNPWEKRYEPVGESLRKFFAQFLQIAKRRITDNTSNFRVLIRIHKSRNRSHTSSPQSNRTDSIKGPQILENSFNIILFIVTQRDVLTLGISAAWKIKGKQGDIVTKDIRDAWATGLCKKNTLRVCNYCCRGGRWRMGVVCTVWCEAGSDCILVCDLVCWLVKRQFFRLWDLSTWNIWDLHNWIMIPSISSLYWARGGLMMAFQSCSYP